MSVSVSLPFFHKSGRILLGARAHHFCAARGLDVQQDMDQGLHTLKAMGADFVLCDLPLPTDLARLVHACTRLALPLCLVAENDAADAAWQSLTDELAGLLDEANPLPVLLASPHRDVLEDMSLRRHNDARLRSLATGLLGVPEGCCTLPGAEAGGQGNRAQQPNGFDVCLLTREEATGCRLCGLRSMGQFTMVLGHCSPQDILRLAIDGADAFVLDDPEEAIAVFARRRQA